MLVAYLRNRGLEADVVIAAVVEEASVGEGNADDVVAMVTQPLLSNDDASTVPVPHCDVTSDVGDDVFTTSLQQK